MQSGSTLSKLRNLGGVGPPKTPLGTPLTWGAKLKRQNQILKQIFYFLTVSVRATTLKGRQVQSAPSFAKNPNESLSSGWREGDEYMVGTAVLFVAVNLRTSLPHVKLEQSAVANFTPLYTFNAAQTAARLNSVCTAGHTFNFPRQQ